VNKHEPKRRSRQDRPSDSTAPASQCEFFSPHPLGAMNELVNRNGAHGVAIATLLKRIQTHHRKDHEADGPLGNPIEPAGPRLNKTPSHNWVEPSAFFE
jgi:hypothetical protein